MKRRRNYVKLRMLEVEIEGDGPKVRKAIDAIATLVTLGRSRESGGSLPDAGRIDPGELRALYGRGEADPPVLNKSGGRGSQAGQGVPVFSVLILRCPSCGFEGGGFEPRPGQTMTCPKCGHVGRVS